MNINLKQINDFVERNKEYIKTGQVATYIPALAKVNPNQLGLSIYDLDEQKIYSFGDSKVRFAIESISKVPSLILAILDNDLETIFSQVGTEPSGFAFNSIMNMEINHKDKPSNPFINAGAIKVVSLIKGKDTNERSQRILNFYREIMNDDNITLDTEIYLSEKETGDINRSLAYRMKGSNIIQGDVTDILDSYFRQCSILVTAENLANLGAVLANKGVMPWNNKRLFSTKIATMVKSLMTTYGLYDESGSFSVHIGIPSKSGVGGGILSAVPNKLGIGVFSPTLDTPGNSVAGMKLLSDVTDTLDLDIFN